MHSLPTAPRSPALGRNRLVTGTVLLALLAGAWWAVQHRAAALSGKAGKAGAAEAVLVATAPVTRRDVPFYAEGLGRVRALNSVLVRSQVDGQITEIAFKEGQDVRAGDLLVQVDPRSFEAALRQKAAKRDQDQAQLDSARSILARNTALQAKGLIDQQAFDVQQAAVRELEALVQSDKAAADEAGLELEHTRITSPIDGRAGLRMVDSGNLVHANDAAGLVVINQVQPIAVVFALPERQWQQIAGGRPPAEGSAVPPLAATAFDRDNRGALATGQLAALDNQIDESSGTIRCKALFPNDRQTLWPGQFVNVRLLAETRQGVLTVPAGGIQQGTDGYFAYVVRPDLTVEARPLQVALLEGGLAVIAAGLAEGETVVVDGQYSLRPGAAIKVAGAKKPGP